MPSKKALVPINIYTGTADPGSAVAGDLYYNSSTGQVKVYKSAWTNLANEEAQTFSYTGAVATGSGTSRFYVEGNYSITSVRASVATAPTGASMIIDVNKNGTTIFTTQGNRPTIAISGNTSGKITNMDVTTLASGDYLTVDVDQVGSTVAGSDLTVIIRMLRTS